MGRIITRVKGIKEENEIEDGNIRNYERYQEFNTGDNEQNLLREL